MRGAFYTGHSSEHCNESIEERYKKEMLANGQWLATVSDNINPLRVGFHINSLYSPYGWKSWAEIAKEWDDAQGDDNKLKVFVNTILGETWKEKTEAPEWEKLYERAEEIKKVMNDVVFITAGVDVQGDRIELEVVGWMEGRKSQSIDYIVLDGDTDKDEVWQKLDAILNTTFEKEDGTLLPLRLMAVDTGYNTHKVYKWCNKYGFSRVIPIKGVDTLETYFSAPKVIDIVKHGQKIGKTKIWQVGVSFIKTEVYSFLRLQKDHETGLVPDGYCFFPKRIPHYFKSLTAEAVQLVRNKKGYIKPVWVNLYKRNEALDTRVYARAAAAVYGMDRWNSARWEMERGNAIQQEVKPLQKKSPAKKVSKKSSFWNR